jgi:glycosyltransferase involved in cell wall biosynthesis
MFRCVLVGDGMNLANETLATMIRKMELDQRIILAGPRDDIPAVMNALDLHVLSSASEAFPNVVAEAMACGTPCVVTDVGDAATIVGSTGWVAPAGDAIQLAGRIEKALVALASPGRDKRSAECRARIAENFSIGKMVEAYESVWIEAAERART